MKTETQPSSLYWYRNGAYTCVFLLILLCTKADWLALQLSIQLSSTTFDHDRNKTRTDNSTAGPCTPVYDELQRPKCLRIAFMGDSLTRYMYLSLAHLARLGRWVDDDDFPNIIEEKQFPTWNHFYKWSAGNTLSPYEQCDCFRAQGVAYNPWTGVENRYYADPGNGTFLMYIGKFGNVSAHGSWDVDIVHEPHPPVHHVQPASYPWTWNWSAVIVEHIAKIQPKVEYLVFNAGYWPHELGDPRVHVEIQQALNQTGIVGIYKTTTWPRRDARTRYPKNLMDHDEALCEFFPCLNLSWTETLNTSAYWDYIHFRSHVNTRMNQELLATLKYFQQGNRSR